MLQLFNKEKDQLVLHMIGGQFSYCFMKDKVPTKDSIKFVVKQKQLFLQYSLLNRSKYANIHVKKQIELKGSCSIELFV